MVTLFLRIRTLNLSKSLRLALTAFFAVFLAATDAAYLVNGQSFLMSFVTTPVLAPLNAPLSENLVSVNLLIGMTYLATPVVGPSTRTLLSLRISTIVANLPSYGP